MSVGLTPDCISGALIAAQPQFSPLQWLSPSPRVALPVQLANLETGRILRLLHKLGACPVVVPPQWCIVNEKAAQWGSTISHFPCTLTYE